MNAHWDFGDGGDAFTSRPTIRTGVALPKYERSSEEDRQRRKWEAMRLYGVLYALALSGIVVILALGGFHG